MRARMRLLVEEAVETGAKMGVSRFLKHRSGDWTDELVAARGELEERIVEEVMLELDERVWWDDIVEE